MVFQTHVRLSRVRTPPKRVLSTHMGDTCPYYLGTWPLCVALAAPRRRLQVEQDPAPKTQCELRSICALGAQGLFLQGRFRGCVGDLQLLRVLEVF